MKGIVVATHGDYGKGILSSLKMFFGEAPQLEALCLEEGKDPDEYAEQLKETVESVDTGDGTLVFCDIAFGTPCNSMMKNFRSFDSEKIEIVAGVNLPMLLQALSVREANEINMDEVLQAGNDGIINVKQKLLSRVNK